MLCYKQVAQHYYGHRLPEPLWVARRVWPAANDPDEGGPVCTSMQQASHRWSLAAAPAAAASDGKQVARAAAAPAAPAAISDAAPLGVGNAQAQTVVVVNACLYSEAHRAARACQGPVDFLVRALPYHSTNKNFRYVEAQLDERFRVPGPDALVVAVVTPPEARACCDCTSAFRGVPATLQGSNIPVYFWPCYIFRVRFCRPSSIHRARRSCPAQTC